MPSVDFSVAYRDGARFFCVWNETEKVKLVMRHGLFYSFSGAVIGTVSVSWTATAAVSLEVIRISEARTTVSGSDGVPSAYWTMRMEL